MTNKASGDVRIPGHASFRAAKMWEINPPDRAGRILVSCGEDLHVPKLGDFAIRDGDVWDLYYAPGGCEIAGPAMISMVNSEMIFGKAVSERLAMAKLFFISAICAAATFGAWEISGRSALVGVMTLAALALAALNLTLLMSSPKGGISMLKNPGEEVEASGRVCDHDVAFTSGHRSRYS